MCDKDGCPMDGTLANDFQCIVDSAKEAWLDDRASPALFIWSGEEDVGHILELEELLGLPKPVFRRELRRVLRKEYHGTAKWYVMVSEAWALDVNAMSIGDKLAVLKGTKSVADCAEKKEILTMSGKANDGSFRLAVYNIIQSGAGIDLMWDEGSSSDGSTGESGSPILDDVLLGLETPTLDESDMDVYKAK